MRKTIAGAGLLLAALTFWLLFYRLGEPNFYHVRNESRRAQIAREMLETRQWLIPRLEEETILTKPPVFYWAIAACSAGGRVTELSSRLPSAVSGAGIVLFTVLIGSLLFSPQTGLAAGFMLLSTNFFLHQARYCELDSMLALFTTAAVYFFLMGYRARRRARLWYGLFFAMLGLGMMTKGPFALTFPLLPIAAWLAVNREANMLLQGRFLWGAAVFLAIALPWPLAVMSRHPDFMRLALGETVVRAVTGFAHREPLLFYVVELVQVFFPWVFFLPFAVWLGMGRRTEARRRQVMFVLLWFFVNFLFLSLLQSKRDYYLFPLVPAFAVLAAAAWEPFFAWLAETAVPRFRRRRLFCLLAGGMLSGAAFLIGNPFAANVPSMHSPDKPLIIFFFGAVLLTAYCVKALLPSWPLSRAVLAGACMLMTLYHFCYFTYSVPIENAFDSGKAFYETAGRIAGGAPLGLFSDYENYTFTFYAARPIITLKDPESLREFSAAPGSRFLVMTGKAWRRLRPPGWSLVYAGRAAEHRSWKGLVLLRHGAAGGGIDSFGKGHAAP